MLSVNVIQKPFSLAKRKYPYLGIRKKKDVTTIVLFNGGQTGICLDTNSLAYDVGYFSDTWVESDFDLFTGDVTLKNNL